VILLTKPNDPEYQVENYLFEGFRAYPKYQLNLTKYNAGEKCFDPFNPYESQYLKNSYRRKLLNRDISSQLDWQTEMKYIRKALDKIISIMPEIAKDKDIQDFVQYSSTVKSKIEKRSKSETSNYDLRKVNGTELQR
jgi:hypothetical protein